MTARSAKYSMISSGESIISFKTDGGCFGQNFKKKQNKTNSAAFLTVFLGSILQAFVNKTDF